jgi:general stress protein 26
MLKVICARAICTPHPMVMIGASQDNGERGKWNKRPKAALETRMRATRGLQRSTPYEGNHKMTNSAQNAWDIMKSLDICFLVSVSPDGMRSRPMSSIVEADETTIYLLSNSTSEQLADINATPKILLNFGNGSNQYVSTSAVATLSTDRALIKRLWNPGAQTFWPEGPEQAEVTVICAIPDAAEYWDGPSGVVTLAKMAVSLVTGSRPDMGENEKVAL